MAEMQLYGYWRSSASYRVRIALALKGLTIEQLPVNLAQGVQGGKAYKGVNPQGFVPALQLEGGQVIGQSLAIIDYLEEVYPTPHLQPARAEHRAYVRQLAGMVCSDIHPLNNLRVLNYLKDNLKVTEEQKKAWIAHWVQSGFEAMESVIQASGLAGECCYGNQPSLADACLIPQIYNARRFGVSMDAYPILSRIDAYCLALPAFMAAHPDNQPDAVTA
jgi:maleylacetoacetate isomerase